MKTITVSDRTYKKNVIRAKQLNKLNDLYMRFLRHGTEEKRRRVWDRIKKVETLMAGSAWVIFDMEAGR